MNRNLPLRLLSLFVIVYMLLAFTWWSVLLYTKNKDAFLAKSELIKQTMMSDHQIHSLEEFFATPEYQTLAKEYKRQEWMILGEGIVFVLSLVAAVWFINQGYHKEMNAALQRRNFLLSITHELKSPIASVKLILQTFQKRSLNPEQQEKLTNTALKETERLNNLVNDLLLAAKIETTYQLQPENFDLLQLTENLIADLKIKYPEVDFEIQSKNQNFFITADKLGLNSVILNLLENAVKYSPEPAKVNVRLARLDENLMIEVADLGIGIADAEKKKIFDQFYRIGNEDTRETKGTGLGLFIVKQVIKAHKGSIKVLDNTPRGSIFRILLPMEN
jgi:signal transduction histidine kinase